MRWKRFDIFISYSRADSGAAHPFVAALVNRGYRVFFDVSSIVVGEQWKARLARAIRSCRVCILCWSKNAQSSDYVAYEYSRAEGLGTPILPWLLDNTPLPGMLEIHGITERDPARAAALFSPRLGWPLARRRIVLAAALLLLLSATSLSLWLSFRPRPWEFTGHVIDSKTKFPLAGVEVDAEQRRFRAWTDKDGLYRLRLPPPRPKYIDLVFSKEGYEGEVPVQVRSDRPFDTDMTKVH